jgi:MFS family permease
MLTAYRRVFATPGTLTMSATGMVARLPISMMTLGIVLVVSTLSGSYTLAGEVSAAYIIGNAVVAVPHGRLADRFGQTRVLYVDSVLFALSTGMLVYAVTHGWSAPWPHLWAALSGVALPQVGSMVRARWAHLLDDESERHTAFAVESIGDEIVFVTGPTLVTFLSTVYAPQTGLLVALAVGTLGSLALAGQPRTQPPVPVHEHGGGRGPMPWGALVMITISAAAMGSLFGAMEVATVAFADHEGHKSLAGVVLGLLSLGSLIAGVLTGARSWRSSVVSRFRIGMTALALGFVVLPFLGNLWALAPMMFLAGFAIAPTLIAMLSHLEAVAPRSRLTEAMGFVQSGLSAGIAPGAYFAGMVADGPGGAAPFWVCVASGVVAAGAAWLTP